MSLNLEHQGAGFSESPLPPARFDGASPARAAASAFLAALMMRWGACLPQVHSMRHAQLPSMPQEQLQYGFFEPRSTLCRGCCSCALAGAGAIAPAEEP
eukprot:5448693-Pyramimonas_sp.AAC.1